MSTKYSTSTGSARTQFARKHDLPMMTKHVLYDRWPSRAPDEAVAPETALRHANRDGLIAHHPHFKREDTTGVMAYHGRLESGECYGMLFIVGADSEERTTFPEIVKTVYRISTVWNPHLRAYLWSLAGDPVDERDFGGANDE